MTRKIWRFFSSIFTIVGLAALLLSTLPAPFLDHNGTTTVGTSKASQIATAKAFSKAIGDPTAELNTENLDRYLFKDGTSVDYLKFQDGLMYRPAALKSIVLGFFSRQSPTDIAMAMQLSLQHDGFHTQIITRPDPAFPDGAIVLVLSDAFYCANDYGFGVIIRKHAFRIGGQKTVHFKSF